MYWGIIGTMTEQHFRRSHRRSSFVRLQVLAVALVAMISLSPRPASAACYDSGSIVSTVGPLLTGTYTLGGLIEQFGSCILGSLPFVSDFIGGEQTAEHMDEWWEEDGKPDIQDATKQMNSATIDRSRGFGSVMDAQMQVETQTAIQKLEDEAARRLNPSEVTCAAGTPLGALGGSAAMTKAMQKAMKSSSVNRSANTNSNAAENGPVHDINSRFDRYCRLFQHQRDNGGFSGCGGPGVTQSHDRRDVLVESSLFLDTIDMTDADERDMVYAVVDNLLEPQVEPIQSELAMQTSGGQETHLRRRNILAIRNLANDVMSGIIARRSSIENTDVAPKIREIRERAGIESDEISNMPSYNEIMLAMTKERFLDPEYFVRSKDNVGAIRQEQSAIDAYTTMMMVDIQELQEQINAMIALRTSLELAKGQQTSVSSSAPNQ